MNRKKWFACVLGTVLAPTLLACGAPSQGDRAGEAKPEPQQGGLVRIASPWNPTDLDVHGRSSNGNFRRFVWQSLLEHERNDPLHDFRIDYVMAPSLAERWEQPSPNTYVFHLRKGVRWHPSTGSGQVGPEFTAKDVIFTFDHMLDPKNKYSTAASLEGVDKYEAQDDYTIRVTRRSPAADGLRTLGEIHIVGRHQGDQGDDFAKVASGTGTMKVVEFVRGTRVVLTRNDEYWEKGKPYIDRFESIMGLERSGQLAAFAARQSDFMIITDRPQFDTVKAAVPDLQYYSYAPGYNYGFRFKLDQPPYNDQRVRKAFHLALDRFEMRNTIAQGEGVINSFSAPGFRSGWGLSEAELKSVPGWRQPKEQDLVEARRLLAEAGYPNGLKTKIHYDQTNSFYPYMTEVALGQLRKAGIQAEGVPQETGAYNKTVAEGLFEVATTGGVGDSNVDRYLRSRWTSNGLDAKAVGLKDAKLDDLIARQDSELNEERRKQLFREIDRYVLDQAYHAPTVSGQYYGVWQPYLMGVYPGFSGQPWVYRTGDLWVDPRQAPAERRTR